MTNVPASFFHYLAAWNTSKPNRIRDHLERAVAPDVLFVDPANPPRGIDELEATIVKARADRPTATYHMTSGIDGHNQRYRYLWEVRIDGKLAVSGMDVTTVDANGAIVQIDGFFGDFPPLES